MSSTTRNTAPVGPAVSLAPFHSSSLIRPALPAHQSGRNRFRRRTQWWALICCGAGLVFNSPLQAASQLLSGTVPAVVAKLKPIGHLPAETKLSLAIGLPLRNPDQLNNLLRQIYDPTSPNYRQYITPAQFTEMFGPTEKDYQGLIRFAAANHLTVTGQHPNRLLLDVQGTVNDIEKAFQLMIYVYQHPTEQRTFYAPNVNPAVRTSVPVLSISGLDNYAIPRPNHKLRLRSGSSKSTPKSGSGPGGTYRGADFRSAYVPGTPLTGAGQNVGLVQFDGYTASDITTYLSQAGISTSVVLTNIPVDGGVIVPGSANSEVCLDIEMVIAMAPGLSKIFVYEAPNPSPWVDILSRMANDNQARQLSCSWGGGDPNPAAEQIFQQMAAQGQSFFNATGDSDAFTGSIPFPSDSPNITQVGGTTLSTTGPAGSYLTEVVWNWGLQADGSAVGSSGGISTTVGIPSWQLGINMAANRGSTTLRNVPDVAMVGDNIAIVADHGQVETVAGTSCAAPLWAGLTALINQQAAQNGLASVGLLNPALYAIGKGADYPADFHDVTTGNNFTSSSPTLFPAVAGYDLCTGWGSPAGTNLINALASNTSLPGETCLPTTQPAQHPFDITRSALYWFTHGYTNAPLCATATLEQAIVVNGGKLNLGFLCLPTANYTSVNIPAISALMEALGFYYKGSGSTGDGLPASALCQARKKLAPELIAAIANNVLLGTTPDHASYLNAGGLTNFPGDLIEQAGAAAAGADVAQIQLVTALLRKFNTSGVTNGFFVGLGQVECSPNPPAFLRQIARDPTTYLNCPGLNDSCSTAENVVWTRTSNAAVVRFQRTVDTRSYSAGTVYWAITPPLGASNRQFTATTANSNFPTTLTVLKGQCTADGSALTVVTSSTASNSFSSTQVSFSTDGVATYFIEAAPAYPGSTGKLRFSLTSP